MRTTLFAGALVACAPLFASPVTMPDANEITGVYSLDTMDSYSITLQGDERNQVTGTLSPFSNPITTIIFNGVNTVITYTGNTLAAGATYLFGYSLQGQTGTEGTVVEQGNAITGEYAIEGPSTQTTTEAQKETNQTLFVSTPEYLIVESQVFDTGNAITGDYQIFEVGVDRNEFQSVLTNTSSSGMGISNAKFFLSDTYIPLSDLNPSDPLQSDYQNSPATGTVDPANGTVVLTSTPEPGTLILLTGALALTGIYRKNFAGR